MSHKYQVVLPEKHARALAVEANRIGIPSSTMIRAWSVEKINQLIKKQGDCILDTEHS